MKKKARVDVVQQQQQQPPPSWPPQPQQQPMPPMPSTIQPMQAHNQSPFTNTPWYSPQTTYGQPDMSRRDDTMGYRYTPQQQPQPHHAASVQQPSLNVAQQQHVQQAQHQGQHAAQQHAQIHQQHQHQQQQQQQQQPQHPHQPAAHGQQHNATQAAQPQQGQQPHSTTQPPPAKKGRTNTPWTAQEELRLKQMRDAGNSWAEIAKTFPTRTEGSVKKHWYKDMHYAEFAENESQELLHAIKEYEASKWKVIGNKVGKPAKACEQYAKENFPGMTLLSRPRPWPLASAVPPSILWILALLSIF
ncbi:hypothetical protein MAPG_09781 [Magnaporthiopsis poae ATCC 64411]|uniref:MYB DNA-binding domain-containing protein n=1 Tax=Magnaporthiopsis poae (strain ATCC 64411 / 73-15) TaxID=644358 RepID=A0A0C4EAV0_MAGP6|nr:hypothetical protein MAPG_09781 [Magnaporthiopsis poae ATCC 64411]